MTARFALLITLAIAALGIAQSKPAEALLPPAGEFRPAAIFFGAYRRNEPLAEHPEQWEFVPAARRRISHALRLLAEQRLQGRPDRHGKKTRANSSRGEDDDPHGSRLPWQNVEAGLRGGHGRIGREGFRGEDQNARRRERHPRRQKSSASCGYTSSRSWPIGSPSGARPTSSSRSPGSRSMAKSRRRRIALTGRTSSRRREKASAIGRSTSAARRSICLGKGCTRRGRI